jgi:hypothetical protein
VTVRKKKNKKTVKTKNKMTSFNHRNQLVQNKFFSQMSETECQKFHEDLMKQHVHTPLSIDMMFLAVYSFHYIRGTIRGIWVGEAHLFRLSDSEIEYQFKNGILPEFLNGLKDTN